MPDVFHLLERVASLRSPVLEREIERWESHSLCFPPDIKDLYRFSDGFSIGKARDSAFKLRSMSELVHISIAIYGQMVEEFEDSLIFAMFDLWDGNYVGLELNQGAPCGYRLLDAFSENFFKQWKDPRVLSCSVYTFLEQCVRTAWEEQPYWWLRE